MHNVVSYDDKGQLISIFNVKKVSSHHFLPCEIIIVSLFIPLFDIVTVFGMNSAILYTHGTKIRIFLLVLHMLC